MAKDKQKGPSFSSLAALTTLALALWMEVDLPMALFRSIVVYLVLSLVSTAYKVILGRYLAISQAKAEQEMLQRLQREAEEEEKAKEEARRLRDEEFKQKQEARQAAAQKNMESEAKAARKKHQEQAD